MNRPCRPIKILGYSAFAVVVFLLSLYGSFPREALRQRLFSWLHQQSGGRATLKANEISLAGLAGVELTRVNLFWTGEGDDKSTRIPADLVEVRVHILPTLSKLLGKGNKKDLLGPLGGFDIRVEQAGGTLQATVSEAAGRIKINGAINKLDLSRTPLRNALPIQLQAVASGTVDLEAGRMWFKNGKGTVTLKASRAKLGPGAIKTPMGPLTIPEIRLNTLETTLKLEKGRLKVASWKQNGPDLESSITGQITLRRNVMDSTMDLRLTFTPDAKFLKQQNKVSSMLQLSGIRKDGKGAYKLTLGGRLKKPVPQGLATGFKFR